MRWKSSALAVLLFGLFTVTASAQAGAAVIIAGGSAIAAGLEIGIGGALVINEFSRPIIPAQALAARRAAYQATLPADSHAAEKHGAEAQAAYNETANTSKPQVTQYDCADGRQRTVNWITGAIRVEQGGQVITAFRYEDREYLKRALLRDGCIEEMPTPPVGHDNVQQMPSWPSGVVPLETGQPVKQRTPSAMELAQARRAMQGGGTK